MHKYIHAESISADADDGRQSCSIGIFTQAVFITHSDFPVPDPMDMSLIIIPLDSIHLEVFDALTNTCTVYTPKRASRVDNIASIVLKNCAVRRSHSTNLSFIYN